jgi:alpha-mannosidase
LAASTDGDQTASFKIGNSAVTHKIQSWTGFIGQWDNRIWSGTFPQGPPGSDSPNSSNQKFPNYQGIVPGFLKKDPVVWFASHTHNANGENMPYKFSYLYAYPFDVPAGTSTLTLPVNDKIRILSASLALESYRMSPAQNLYDYSPISLTKN